MKKVLDFRPSGNLQLQTRNYGLNSSLELSTYCMPGTILNTFPLLKPMMVGALIIPISQLRKLRYRFSKWRIWLPSLCALLLCGSVQVAMEPLVLSTGSLLAPGALCCSGQEGEGRRGLVTSVPVVSSLPIRGLKCRARRDHVGDINESSCPDVTQQWMRG